MPRNLNFIMVLVATFLLWGIASGGCVTDPIKSVKNNPDQMDILMNHIANDDTFRAKMIEKLISTGDRQKLAELLVKDEDISRILVSKIFETGKGKADICARVGNRKEYILDALDKALVMYEYKEPILDKLLSNKEMADFMRTSPKMRALMEQKVDTESKEGTGTKEGAMIKPVPVKKEEIKKK